MQFYKISESISHYKFKQKKIEFMPKTQLSDFTDLVQIGHGAFGTVYKATYIKTRRQFALKKMLKKELQKKNMVTQINTEIKIMKEMKFQHIIRYYDCFEDEDHIYLLLQLANNGQLFDKLKKRGRFSEDETRKMIQGVVAAVQFLHSQNPPIIHRDIKPQNLLLDRNNKIKLADFGWSNFSNKTRKTYCGTVDYLAPEMIDQTGHDERLDIWCIGVLVYQLLTGKTPFLGETQHHSKNEIYKNILNVKIQFPTDFPPMAKDFVLGMIKRSPSQRMTLEQIKAHPWFCSKNQSEMLEKKQLQPIKTGTTSTYVEISKNEEPSSALTLPSSKNNEKQIIRKLNKTIKQLEQENTELKIKEKQRNNGTNSANNSEQISKLHAQIRRLKAVEQLTDKYKKSEQKLWENISQKQKQLINIRIQLKKIQDQNEDLQFIKKQKQKYVEKTKRLQRQMKSLQQKNRNLEEKLEQANSGIQQRAKNGDKIMLAQASDPQFLTYLQQQILQLTQKFETSRHVFTQMLQKEKKNQEKQEQLARLRAQQKKMKQIIRAELRQIYQNEKDDVLEKARLELEDQRRKWFRERQQLIASFEQSGSSSGQASTMNSNRQEDLLGQLRNIKQLNRTYEKTIEKQKSQIQDLKQQLKRLK